MEENGQLVKFLFNEDKEVIVEETNEGVIRYIRGLGIISSDSESARTYYHYVSDNQGSVRLILTDTVNDRRIRNYYYYDAFGESIISHEDIHNRFRFNGEQYDPVTSQYYLRARYYNPVIGRFTQEDTYYGDGLNLYEYCKNNPILYRDSSGHDAVNQKNLYRNESGSDFAVPDSTKFPRTRQDIHNDLISRGYHTTGTTDRGYVVYKDSNGNTVTIKPSGEVIPTIRMPVDPNNTSPKAPKYNQRTYYDGTIIPDELNDHTTGHNVGKISVDDFYPEPHKWEGEASWMKED